MTIDRSHLESPLDLTKVIGVIQGAVNHASRKAEATGQDLDTLYKRFGLKSEGYFWSSATVSQLLDQRLKRYLSRVNKSLMNDLLTRMRKYLLYTHLKTRNDIADVWNVLARCQDELRQLKNQDEQANHSELSLVTLIKVSMIWAWMRRCGPVHDDFASSHRIAHEEWDYAKTVMYIEKIMSNCRVVYGDIDDKELVVKTLFERIEHRIRIYGATEFVIEILHEYRQSFVAQHKVFGSSKLSVRKFLLTLGIKLATAYCNKNDTSKKPSSQLKSVIYRMSNALLNLFAVRGDNPFLFMFMGDPIEYFQKIVIQDTLYKDFQYVPEAMLVLLENVLQFHESRLIEKMNLSVVEFVTISRAIMSVALQQLGSSSVPTMTISIDHIVHKLNGRPISREKVRAYIANMQSTQSLNQHFSNPMDMLNVNSDSEWLVPEYPGGDSYFLPLPSIHCFGLYDKVLGQLGDYGGFLDIGINFEGFVRGWVSKQYALPAYSGKFVHKGQVFETDGVLVAGNYVLLLECKTKPIRRDSRSGLIAQLLIDFANSYIYSQLQAYRCEAAFREGRLALYPSDARDPDVSGGSISPSVVLTLPENPIFIRITCTPTSYGSFNEPLLCSNVLEAVAMYDFGTTVPNLQSKFRKLAETKIKLLQVWEDLKQYYLTDEDQSHFIKDITFYSNFMPFALMFILMERNASKRQPLERLLSYSHSQSEKYDVLSILDIINNNSDQIFGRILRKQTNGPITL